MSDSRTPTMAEVLRRAIDARLFDVRVAIPAKVTRYDKSKGQVDVQPLVKDRYVNADGDEEVVEVPVIPNVPVLFPGSGGFRVTFPVQVGDVVQLLVNDRSLDAWKQGGGTVDPIDPRVHNLSDAVALPGLRDFSHAWTGGSDSSMNLGQDGGLQIEFDGSQIKLGGADDAVAMANAVKTDLDAFKAAFNSHQMTVNVAVTVDTSTGIGTGTGLATLPVPQASPTGTLGSSVVKVKS